MSTVQSCVACSTQYAIGLDACPHCGSTECEVEGAVVARRFPSFVTITCPECGRGPWTVRLSSVTSGLIDLPTLACASCGSRVPVTWPPEEEPMSPKITAHGGATNAREADVSPAVAASEPQVAAEGDLGRQTSEDLDTVQDSTVPEPDEVQDENKLPDYDGMTLAELRSAADSCNLPTYGTKAQLIERLRDAE